MIGLGLHTAKSGVVSKSYSPADSPRVWYNEDSIASYGLFQPITTLTDMSGNGLDLTQDDPAKRPEVHPISGNSGTLKTMKFTNDSVIDGSLDVLSDLTNFTIVYAGGNFNNYNTAIYIGDDDNPDDTSSFRMGRDSSSNKMRAIVGDNANGAFVTPYLLRTSGYKDILYAYKRGTDSSNIYLGLDNGSSVNETQFGISGLELSFGAGMGIGTNNPDDPALTGTGANWIIFEMLIYDRDLTPEELENTRMYLRKKWKV